jgi:hypothetical protein
MFAVLGAVGVLAIAATTVIYAAHLTYYDGPPIRSDGLSYYVYLPAVLLDHDVTMVRTADRSFGGKPTNISDIDWTRNTSGKRVPLDPHGVGVAVLMLPFFAAGDLLAVVANEPRNGFSWPYQAADDASGLTYVLLGLALTAAVLRRWFARRTVIVTILAITFGAAVFEYATYDASYSHGYSFFLVALAMRLTLSVWDRPRLSAAAALGATLGLVGLVRPTNLVLLLFCGLVGIERLADIPRRARSLLQHADLVAVGASVLVLTLLPQFLYLYLVTGSPFANPYRATPGAHLNPLDPHVFDVLFSVRKGLFFWTPLLVIAVAGLPRLRQSAPPLFAPAVLYLVITTWIVSSWATWWYGGSFGMRALIDAMPVFALGLAALYETTRGAAAFRGLNLAIGLTTLLAIHGMLTYWLKAIPYDQTTFSEYLHSFLHYGGHTWHLND